MEEQIEFLKSRVSRLERSNRAMKCVNALAFAVLVGMSRIPLSSAVTPGPIATTQLHLVSGSGTVLASLAADSDGANLTFFETGKRAVRVGFGPGKGTAGLVVFDGTTVLPGSGRLRGQWGISSKAGAGEQIVDKKGLTRAALATNASDSGEGWNFSDTKGHRLAKVGESDDGTDAGLFAFDGNSLAPGKGNLRLAFGAAGPQIGSGGSFGGSVFGPGPVLRYGFGAALDGSAPGSASYDSNGKLSTFEGVGTDPRFEGLFLYDADGTIRVGIDTDQAHNIEGMYTADSKGQDRVGIGTDYEGPLSYMNFQDAAGTFRLGLAIDGTALGDGSESFYFDDPAGTNLGLFAAAPKAGGKLTTHGVNGKETGHLP